MIQDIFGVSKLLGTSTFNSVLKGLVSTLFNQFVRLKENDEDWTTECKGFIENYKFLCVAAWEGFPVNVLTKLKKTIVVLRIVIQLRTSLALVGQNKRFLHLTTGTTGT